MDRTKHIQDDVSVEFSETACMQSSTGDVYCAFPRYSYISRVTFPNGDTVCVSHPQGSRTRGKTELVNEAIQAALGLPDGGAAFL